MKKPVHSTEAESQPWIASDQSLYFCKDNKKMVAGTSGRSDINFSKYANGKYSEPVLLGKEINAEYIETEPTLSPNNSYLY